MFLSSDFSVMSGISLGQSTRFLIGGYGKLKNGVQHLSLLEIVVCFVEGGGIYIVGSAFLIICLVG